MWPGGPGAVRARAEAPRSLAPAALGDVPHFSAYLGDVDSAVSRSGAFLGLVATGNWRDPRSAARYAHVVARDEWERVEKLPALDAKNMKTA